jgi:hypothetical protein
MGQRIKIMGREIELEDYAGAAVEVPQPTSADPAHRAWLQDVREGTTASDPVLEEAARIAAMTMDDFAAYRRQIGLTKSLVEFLEGN